MKKLSLLLSTLFTLSAASLPYTVLASESSSLETSSTEATESKPEVDKSTWGKRSNPVPLGETFEISTEEYTLGGKTYTATFDLSVKNVYRGAKAVELLNEYADEAPFGHEWVVLELHMNYKSGDEDEALRTNPFFKVFSAKGKEIPQTDYEFPNDGDEFEGIELYPENEHQGYIVVHVPKDEEFVLVFDTFDKKFFFATK